MQAFRGFSGPGAALLRNPGLALGSLVGIVSLAAAAPAAAAPAWTVVAGQTTTQKVTFVCVPETSPLLGANDGHRVFMPAHRAAARPGLGPVCTGEVIVAYDALPDLSVISATLQGLCTTTQWYTACPVDLPVNQRATLATELALGPYGRRDAGNAYVTMPEPEPGFSIPIGVSTAGTVSASQSTAVVIPGTGESVPAVLSVHNSGPSGAIGVSVSEVLPTFISADPSGACRFDRGSNTVTCAWDRIDPGATLSVPLKLSAQSGYPLAQLQTSLRLNSDLGNTESNATIAVTGQAIVGMQSFNPTPAQQMSTVIDTVSVQLVAGAVRGLPAPGVPVSFQASFPAGLQVQGLSIGPDAAGMHCSATGNVVQCVQPALGSSLPGSDAKVAITLYPTAQGTQTTSLQWSSGAGVQGATSAQLDVHPVYSSPR